MEYIYTITKKEMIDMSTDVILQKDITKKQFRNIRIYSLVLLAFGVLSIFQPHPVGTAFGILGAILLIASFQKRRTIKISATKQINTAWSLEEVEIHTTFTEDTKESKVGTAYSSISYTSFTNIQQINSFLYISVKNQASGIIIPAKAFASPEERDSLFSFIQNKISLNPAQ